MLVLSRRAGERIVFPALDIKVELLRVNGNVARIGIDAPPSIRVLREEIEELSAAETPDAKTHHQNNNRLNQLVLGLYLAKRQSDAGMADKARATLESLLNKLDHVDLRRMTNQEKRSRMLVVEDDANERELLAGFLRMNGCECDTAADGEEALEYLKRHDRPDVVLLDMQMPRCDGPAALRSIRRDPKLQGLRVISISGLSPDQLGVPVGPDGVDAWFAKPLNPTALWDAVRRASHN